MAKDYESISKHNNDAYEKENEFLKKEVIGQGANTGEEKNHQNKQTNIEKPIEDKN